MATPPKWLEPNRGRVKKSKKQELRLAKELGAKRLIRSGAVPKSKYSNETQGGDIESKSFLFEQKSTEAASIILKLEWLGKVQAGARKKVKNAAIIISFIHGPGRVSDWVLISKDVFQRLVK